MTTKLSLTESTKDALERFNKRWDLDKKTGCHVWNGPAKRNKCGQFRFRGKNRSAHRVSYILSIKDIPDNTGIKQTCNNSMCVNPDHLERKPYSGKSIAGDSVPRGSTKSIILLRGIPGEHKDSANRLICSLSKNETVSLNLDTFLDNYSGSSSNIGKAMREHYVAFCEEVYSGVSELLVVSHPFARKTDYAKYIHYANEYECPIHVMTISESSDKFSDVTFLEGVRESFEHTL